MNSFDLSLFSQFPRLSYQAMKSPNDSQNVSLSTLLAMALAALAILQGCSSAIRTYRIQTTEPARLGVRYFLPQTVVTIKAPVVRTRWTPGRFSDVLPYFFPCLKSKVQDSRPYAPPACGDSGNPYSEAISRFSIENPEITTRSERDPNQQFVIDLKGHLLEDKKLGLEFSEDGVPGRVEAESTNRTGEFIGQIVKGGASVFSAAWTGGILGTQNVNAPSAGVLSKTGTCTGIPTSDPLSESSIGHAKSLGGEELKFFCALPEHARISFIGMPSIIRIKFREYVGVPGSAIKDDDLKVIHFLAAFETFARLGKTKESLRSVQVSASEKDATAEGLSARLKALQDDLDRDIASFFGRTQERVIWNGIFEARPDKNSLTAPLFGLDEEKGICLLKASQAIVKASEDPGLGVFGACTPQTPRVRISLQESNMAKPVTETASSGGFFYRVPGLADAGLTWNQRTLARRRVGIAQYGVIAALPTTTGGRKTTFTFDVYTATGALKTFKMGSEALLEKSMVTDAETAANAVVGALATEAAKKRDNADELNQLERRRALLEKALAIQELEDSLKKPPAKEGVQE